MIASWKVVASLSTSGATGRYGRSGGRSTSRKSITASSEAAALCAGMPENWFCAATAKWGDLDAAKNALVQLLTIEVQNMAAANQ